MEHKWCGDTFLGFQSVRCSTISATHLPPKLISEKKSPEFFEENCMKVRKIVTGLAVEHLGLIL